MYQRSKNDLDVVSRIANFFFALHNLFSNWLIIELYENSVCKDSLISPD